MPTLNVKILTKPGEWIPGHNQFHKTGTVVAVDEFVVKNRLAKLKDRFEVTNAEAKVDTTVNTEPTDERVEARKKADEESRSKPASEIYELDFPGRDELIKGGIVSVDNLDQFIADNGDAWFKKINGIGPATAADIVAFRAKLKK